MDPIDNVSRDSKDGTYRCPQCQTPFTRRSNLRRHFQIHLRGTSLKCEVCNEEHSTKDSLQDHVSNSHSPTWNVSHENPLRRFVIPQDITSHSPFATVSPPSYGPFSSQNTSISQYPNVVYPAPSRACQVPNFGRLNFSTSGSSSTLSSAANLPRSTSSMTSDRRTPMVGSPPSSNSFSHRRSSTSLSSINSSIAPLSPYTRAGPSQLGPQQGHYGRYPSSEAPPLSTDREWLAEIMERQQGLDGDERPIYTRQEVKNMLDVVSDCFIESVERVLNANGQRPSPPNPARPNNHSTTLDTGVRQMILIEAIPRLLSRLQGNDDVNVMSHVGGGF